MNSDRPFSARWLPAAPIVSLAIVVATLGGCGSQDDAVSSDGVGPDSSEATAPVSTEVTSVPSDFQVDPQAMSAELAEISATFEPVDPAGAEAEISKSEAIDLATENYQPGEGQPVDAALGYFSHDQSQLPIAAEPVQTPAESRLAWVVVFDGLSLAGRGGIVTGEAQVNTQMNVIIDASTGRVLALVTYK